MNYHKLSIFSRNFQMEKWHSPALRFSCQLFFLHSGPCHSHLFLAWWVLCTWATSCKSQTFSTSGSSNCMLWNLSSRRDWYITAHLDAFGHQPPLASSPNTERHVRRHVYVDTLCIMLFQKNLDDMMMVILRYKSIIQCVYTYIMPICRYFAQYNWPDKMMSRVTATLHHIPVM